MRAVTKSKMTASNIVSLFMDSCVGPYEIPEHALTNNGTQLISKRFESIWTFKYETLNSHGVPLVDQRAS